MPFWTEVYDNRKTLQHCQLWSYSHCKEDGFSTSEGRIWAQAYNPRWTNWSRSPIYLTGNFMWSGGNLGYKFRLTAVKNNFSRLLVNQQMSF